MHARTEPDPGVLRSSLRSSPFPHPAACRPLEVGKFMRSGVSRVYPRARGRTTDPGGHRRVPPGPVSRSPMAPELRERGLLVAAALAIAISLEAADPGAAK